MDVLTAFLNGDINEIIHMEQPEGFVKPGNADNVCRLRKALYGLKQANRQWYAKMDKFLCEDLGFIRNAADNCFYVQIKGGHIRLIALYVDDLLIACNDKASLDEIKKSLSMTFEMKDMGDARKCLGLEIFRNRKAGILTVSQPEYANMVLARYDMAEAYGAKTPIEC
jgi:Reverse transcriptase (RNA-dependent DNA polymerase)